MPWARSTGHTPGTPSRRPANASWRRSRCYLPAGKRTEQRKPRVARNSKERRTTMNTTTVPDGLPHRITTRGWGRHQKRQQPADAARIGIRQIDAGTLQTGVVKQYQNREYGHRYTIEFCRESDGTYTL